MVKGFRESKKVSQNHTEAESSEGVNQVKKEGRAFGFREEDVQSLKQGGIV